MEKKKELLSQYTRRRGAGGGGIKVGGLPILHLKVSGLTKIKGALGGKWMEGGGGGCLRKVCSRREYLQKMGKGRNGGKTENPCK